MSKEKRPYDEIPHRRMSEVTQVTKKEKTIWQWSGERATSRIHHHRGTFSDWERIIILMNVEEEQF